ncbi:MAG: serine hydrolase domain-containing protein [Pseudomonadota bacterium]
MSRGLRLWATCTLAALLPLPTLADISDPRFASAIDQARTAFGGLHDRMGGAGMSIAVAFNGELIWSEGLGFSDLEAKTRMRPDQPMPIGSVSKPLTATGAALAVGQGLLNPDEPIQTYVPTFPDKGYAITPRQLSAHMGGIRDYNVWDGFRLPDTPFGWLMTVGPYTNVNEALDVFKDDELIDKPGALQQYTPFGPVLLSAAIQGAVDQPFQDYMRSELLLPLGMRNTFPFSMAECEARCAKGYRFDDDSLEKHDLKDISYKWSGGGFVSTAEDLGRLGAGILNRTDLFPPEIGRMMLTVQAAENGDARYGWNWVVDVANEVTVLEDSPSFYHTGGVLGYNSFVQIFYQLNLVVAITANTFFSDDKVAILRSIPSDHIAPLFIEAFAQDPSLATEAPALCEDDGCSDAVLRAALVPKR